MWLRLRKTDRRGRSARPRTARRTRAWRRCRVIFASAFFSMPLLLRLPADGAPGFARLQPDPLARVPDTLALVGIWLADRADPRGDLADELLVDPGDTDAVRLRHLERDALGGGDLHGVAEPHLEGERRALLGGAISDALDLEIHFEPFRDAADHIRQQRPGQAVQRLVAIQMGRPPHDDGSVGKLHGDIGMHVAHEAALGPQDRDRPPADLDLDAPRDRDGRIPYA